MKLRLLPVDVFISCQIKFIFSCECNVIPVFMYHSIENILRKTSICFPLAKREATQSCYSKHILKGKCHLVGHCNFILTEKVFSDLINVRN